MCGSDVMITLDVDGGESSIDHHSRLGSASRGHRDLFQDRARHANFHLASAAGRMHGLGMSLCAVSLHLNALQLLQHVVNYSAGDEQCRGPSGS